MNSTISTASKRCTKCGDIKPVSDFYRKRKVSSHSWCKFCEREYTKDYLKSPHGRARRLIWLAANPGKVKLYQKRMLRQQRRDRREDPDRFRSYDLKKRIGITLTEKTAKFEEQGKKCAICRTIKPNTKNTWFADHSHTTRTFRGVLCGKCNAVLGFANDNPQILAAAIQYLDFSKKSE